MKKFITTITITTAMIMTGCGGAGTGSETITTAESTTAVADEAVDTAAGEVSEATQKIIDKGVLTVGSSGDLYAYIDQSTGEFAGPDADIIKEAAKRPSIAEVKMSLILLRAYCKP